MPYVKKTITTGNGEVFEYRYFKIKKPQKKTGFSLWGVRNVLSESTYKKMFTLIHNRQVRCYFPNNTLLYGGLKRLKRKSLFLQRLFLKGQLNYREPQS